MRSVTVDRVMAEARAASFTRRSIKEEAKLQGLCMALSMTDLTTLEGKDSRQRIAALCRKARLPAADMRDLPHVAAVCVYPNHVSLAAELLAGSGIHIASVATSFPSGQSPLELRLEEVRDVVEFGADEVDMVINRGAFLAGDYATVQREIEAIKEACGDAHLKVILETGELETFDKIRLASDLAIEAGADFIKTSTGKIQPAATMPVVLVMLESIRDHYLATGRKIGMKPAGGISTAKLALHYLVMVKETLGDDWLTPDLFRFGASSLVNDLVRQIRWKRTGSYTANYDVSIG
ncbi:MAG: deoxyribose-phosphate aldolase [Xanthomonadales bacterium]|nr:deoxyribose-phosphate aldolase [Xanthomonadales bacterium]